MKPTVTLLLATVALLAGTAALVIVAVLAHGVLGG
jgi:hypothetical protein